MANLVGFGTLRDGRLKSLSAKIVNSTFDMHVKLCRPANVIKAISRGGEYYLIVNQRLRQMDSEVY